MKHRVLPLFNVICYVMVTLFVVLWTNANLLPSVEGEWKPVVTKVKLYDTQPYPEGGTISKGVADKLRECSYLRIEWFMGTPDRYVPVEVYFTDPPAINGVGALEWKGIVVNLDERNLVRNSFAYVYHDCGGLWDVRTRFY